MIVLPPLHDQVHIEPGGTGSAEIPAPPRRIDTPGVERGHEAQAEHGSRDAGTAASGPQRAASFRGAGRQAAAPMATAGTRSGTLPDAYIGAPRGNLTFDPRNAHVLMDESKQPYVAVGQHYYAIRNDPANGTWRVVQPQDPTKPGIPIRPDRAGEWQVHRDVGLPAGRPLLTRAQIDNDLRETRATLDDLLVRRLDARQNIRDTYDLTGRYETFRQQMRADQQSLRDDIDLQQGMSDFFARQIGRGNADPSYQTALEQARLQIERRRASMQSLQRLIDDADTHIDTLRSRIAGTSADLDHIRESIARADRRIDELTSQLNDFG